MSQGEERVLEAQQAARVICDRHSNFRRLQNLLQALNLPSSSGFDRTADALVSRASQSVEQAQQVLQLVPFVEGSVLAGEKRVTLFRLDDKSRDSLRKLLGKMDIDTTVQVHFPPVGPDADLTSIDNVPRLVSRARYGDGIVYVFQTKRAYLESTEIPLSQLTESAKEKYKGARKISVKIERERLFYDVLFLPDQSEYVELRQDTSGGIKPRDLDAARRALQTWIAESISILGGTFQFDRPVDLFRLVSDIYADNDGKVRELHYAPPTGTVQKSVRPEGASDFRKDAYHAAGLVGIHGVVNPYRLVVWWDYTHSDALVTRPELEIPGTLQALESPGSSTIHSFSVRAALSFGDYDLVMRKVRSRLVKLGPRT